MLFLFRYSVTFTPDSRYLVSGSADQTVAVWRATGNFTSVQVLDGHSGEVNSVAASRDGQFVVSGGDDGAVRVWSTATWAEVQTLTLTGGRAGEHALSVAVSADARFVLAGWSSGIVTIWDATSWSLARELGGLPGYVWSVTVTPPPPPPPPPGTSPGMPSLSSTLPPPPVCTVCCCRWTPRPDAHEQIKASIPPVLPSIPRHWRR